MDTLTVPSGCCSTVVWICWPSSVDQLVALIEQRIGHLPLPGGDRLLNAVVERGDLLGVTVDAADAAADLAVQAAGDAGQLLAHGVELVYHGLRVAEERLQGGYGSGIVGDIAHPAEQILQRRGQALVRIGKQVVDLPNGSLVGREVAGLGLLLQHLGSQVLIVNPGNVCDIHALPDIAGAQILLQRRRELHLLARIARGAGVGDVVLGRGNLVLGGIHATQCRIK